MIYRLGELFCGPGGFALGAIRARIKNPDYEIVHQWAVDFDEDTCNTYRKNICKNNPGSVLQTDVRKLDMAKLPMVDALAFGFPCNDYSIVGKQHGTNGNFGNLYMYCVQALNYFNPHWFVAENVVGLMSANEGEAFKAILSDFAKAGRFGGYNLTPHLYKFEEYGIPQKRHRIIIVGLRQDLDFDYKVPSPVPYRDINVSCRDAIENPPISPEAKNNERTRQSKNVIERLMHIEPGQNAFTASLPPELKLNISGATLSNIYRRLDPSKPSYTVTGSGGGGTHIYHWSEPRALTNRERARLQTFPDDFVFMGNKQSVRKQIGMAVPCNVAEIIFKSILRTLANEKYDHLTHNNLPQNTG